MRLPRLRLRTLMIAVAVLALDLAGLTCDSPAIFTISLIATVFTPFIALLACIAREIGINTLFR